MPCAEAMLELGRSDVRPADAADCCFRLLRCRWSCTGARMPIADRGNVYVPLRETGVQCSVLSALGGRTAKAKTRRLG